MGIDDPALLRADCSQCASLCCMAPAFDKSESFAMDKPAQTPCPHLDDAGACTIHDERARMGFHGCICFDCLGAGQRVTQELFGGRSWRDDKSLVTPMSRSFTVMNRIHAMLGLLVSAKELPLEKHERERAATLLAALNPPDGWDEAALEAAPVEQMERDVKTFLQTLRHHASARR